MYEAANDPYLYPGTSVLRNRLNLRSQAELSEFEEWIVAVRAEEALPQGSLNAAHYCSIHRHLFQDVYDWAGEIRSVRIAKSGSMFCYPEHIEREMARVFGELQEQDGLRGKTSQEFVATAAHFLAELNAIHPFREGNGRAQSVFLTLVAGAAGHPLDFERLDPPAMLKAMIASFSGDEAPLADVLRGLLGS